MKKLQSDYVITKTDTLGMEESAFSGASSGGLFASLTGAKKPAPVTNPSPNDTKANQPSTLAEHTRRLFTLSNGRDSLALGDLQKEYIIAHIAATAGARFPYERVFRSAQRLLMDSALTEWAFISEFFGAGQRRRKIGRLPIESDQKQPVKPKKPEPAANQPVVAPFATGGQPATPNASDSDRDDDGSKAAAIIAAAANNPFLNPKQEPVPPTTTPQTSGSAPPPTATKPATAAAPIASASGSGGDRKDSKEAAPPQAAAKAKPSGEDDEDGDGGGGGDDGEDDKEGDGGDEPPHDPATARHSIEQVMFTRVFAPTLSLFLENLEDHLFNCWDALGLLLLIRIVCQHNKMMQTRRVHCLDAFFDRLNMLLWPRFKIVLDLHTESIKQLKAAAPGKGKAATAPHYVSARYAEFSAAIIKLNLDYRDDILIHTMRRVRTELDKLLLRSASRLSPAKLQSVYLINNYQSIRSIVDMRVGSGVGGSGLKDAGAGGAGSGGGGAANAAQGQIEEVTFFDGLMGRSRTGKEGEEWGVRFSSGTDGLSCVCVVCVQSLKLRCS